MPPSSQALDTHTTMNRILSLTLLVLIVWCVVWETVGAPIRTGGTFFALKGLLLAPLLPRIWRGERRGFQVLSLVILLYLLEGLTRSYADINPVSRLYAWGEVVLGTLIFILSLRILRQENKQHALTQHQAGIEPIKQPRKKITAAQYTIALCVIWAIVGLTTHPFHQAYTVLSWCLFTPLIAAIGMRERSAVLLSTPLVAITAALTLMVTPSDPLWEHTPYAWIALLMSVIGFLVVWYRAPHSTNHLAS